MNAQACLCFNWGLKNPGKQVFFLLPVLHVAQEIRPLEKPVQNPEKHFPGQVCSSNGSLRTYCLH